MAIAVARINAMAFLSKSSHLDYYIPLGDRSKEGLPVKSIGLRRVKYHISACRACDLR